MPNERYNRTLLLVGVVMMALVNMFLLVPFALYDTNLIEFSGAYWQLVKYYSIISVAIFILLVLFGVLLRGSMRERYISIMVVVSILMWVYGNIIVWRYGVLDGRTIDWSLYAQRGWIDAAVWMGSLLAAIFSHKRVIKHLLPYFFIILIIQMLYVGYKMISDPERYAAKVNATESSAALTEIMKYSSNKNIIHLVVDGFQADVFGDLVEKNPRYRDGFNGFEFYSEAIGVFPYTRFSVPAYLGGNIYRNKTEKDSFIGSMLSGHTILNSAYDAGYEVDIVDSQYWVPHLQLGKHNNAYVISNDFLSSGGSIAITDAILLLDLTLFRVAPHFLKEYIYRDQKWLVNSIVNEQDFMRHDYFLHTAFMRYMTAGMTIDRENPVYKYIHIMNTHNPMVVSERCGYAGRVMPTTREALSIQSFCTIETLLSYFRKLKELGIYDDAMIVLHGDHGGWVEPLKYEEQVIRYNKYTNNESVPALVVHPWLAGLATPLVAIKLPGAREPMKESLKPASLLDLPDTISGGMGLGQSFGGRSLMDLQENEPRTRRFYYYNWQEDAWEAQYTGPIHELVIHGSLYDYNWEAGEIFYPPEDSKAAH